MSKQERRAYVQAITARYAVAGRSQKSVMLDEYCATAKVGRKYAIAQMGRANQALTRIFHRSRSADEPRGALLWVSRSISNIIRRCQSVPKPSPRHSTLAASAERQSLPTLIEHPMFDPDCTAHFRALLWL